MSLCPSVYSLPVHPSISWWRHCFFVYNWKTNSPIFTKLHITINILRTSLKNLKKFISKFWIYIEKLSHIPKYWSRGLHSIPELVSCPTRFLSAQYCSASFTEYFLRRLVYGSSYFNFHCTYSHDWLLLKAGAPFQTVVYLQPILGREEGATFFWTPPPLITFLIRFWPLWKKFIFT